MEKTWFRKSYKWAFSVLLISGIFWSCQDDKEVLPIHDKTKPIKLSGFIPVDGGVGTQLVLKGNNFGSDTSIVKVWVNEKKARVIGVNDTRIYAVVPSRAGKGKIKLQIGKKEKISETDFNYEFRQMVTTMAGYTKDNGDGESKDGDLSEAGFFYPYRLAMDKDKNMFVVERRAWFTPNTTNKNKGYCGRWVYRYITSDDNRVKTILTAGGAFPGFRCIAFSNDEETLYCGSDSWRNGATGAFKITRGQGWYDPTEIFKHKTVNGIIVNPIDGTILFADYFNGKIHYFNPKTEEKKELLPLGPKKIVVEFAFTKDGKKLYASIFEGTNSNKGWMFSGDWNAEDKTLDNWERIESASGYLNSPAQMVFDSEGYLYICNQRHSTIERFDPITKTFKVFAGQKDQHGYLDGLPSECKFNHPTGIAIDEDDVLYIADNGNHRIRKIVVE